jgi:hypothetical protein
MQKTMSNIIIKTMHLDECTIGRLEIQGSNFKCFTLELPDLDNAQDISCINGGKYRYVKRLSPTLGWVIHILDVEGRTWIYIHAGNYTSQILGCILVGQAIEDINRDGTPDVADSAPIFNKLMSVCKDFGTVTIERSKFIK